MILASKSPRRQQLLREAGFEFEVIVRPVEEQVVGHLTPREVALRIAEDKARAYSDLSQNHLIITADTIVVLDEHILGKPSHAAEATRMLQQLSGRSHEVISAVCLYHQNHLHSFSERTEVCFRELEAEEIQHYITHYRPFDKAGAYGIQEWIGMVGISGIRGDYYNVMGLPLAGLYRELKSFPKGVVLQV